MAHAGFKNCSNIRHRKARGMRCTARTPQLRGPKRNAIVEHFLKPAMDYV